MRPPRRVNGLAQLNAPTGLLNVPGQFTGGFKAPPDPRKPPTMRPPRRPKVKAATAPATKPATRNMRAPRRKPQ